MVAQTAPGSFCSAKGVLIFSFNDPSFCAGKILNLAIDRNSKKRFDYHASFISQYQLS